MTIKRVQRKTERPAEEQARIDALRAKYERDKPGPDQLAATGEYERVQAGAYWEVRRVMTELKAERERQGLTLTEVAQRAGLDKGAISKLEAGRQVNPTIDTLSRIATALGLTFGTSLRRETEADAANGSPPETARRLLSSLQELQAWISGQVADGGEKSKRSVRGARR